jgi:cell division protein FtsZ
MADRSRIISNAVIKVIGVGGGGGNAINTMIESGLEGVEFIAANTDIQALESNQAPIKIQLGRELTKGLGAGANPDVGHDAALEDKAIIQEIIGQADMVFVTAGMGGGTGTGAAPVIAQVARELGALTVGVVTKPFLFEGKKRRSYGELGIQQMRAAVDTLITIPNQRLISIAPANMSMLDGFRLADDVLLNAVKGISEIINIPGRINVDFADVKTVMSEMGMALMGTGSASGPNRATAAAQSAISSPLLEDVDIEGATGLLINITGSELMTLHEISEASSLIQEAAHEDANIILGAAIDPSLNEEIRVTVIATGFDQAHVAPPEPHVHHRKSFPVATPTSRSTPPPRPMTTMDRGQSHTRVQHSPTHDEREVHSRSSGYSSQPSVQPPFSQTNAPTPAEKSVWSDHAPLPLNALHHDATDAAPPHSESIRPEAERLARMTYELARSESRYNSDEDADPRAGASVASENKPIQPDSTAASGHIASAEEELDPLTAKALRIAREFTAEKDLEKPAFLRQRGGEEPQP